MINDATALVAFRVALGRGHERRVLARRGAARLRRRRRRRRGDRPRHRLALHARSSAARRTRRWASCSPSSPPTRATSWPRSCTSPACSAPSPPASTPAGTRTPPSTPAPGSPRIAFWRVMVLGLEAMLFILLGLQAPAAGGGARRRAARRAGGRRRPRRRRGADGLRAASRRPASATRGASGSRSAGRACAARSRSPPRSRSRSSVEERPVILLHHVRRDLRDPARPGPHARAAAAQARPARATSAGRPTRRPRGWRPPRRRSTGSRSSRSEGAPGEPVRRLRELYRGALRAVRRGARRRGELPEDGPRELKRVRRDAARADPRPSAPH